MGGLIRSFLGSLNSILGLKKSSERNAFFFLGSNKLGPLFSGGGMTTFGAFFESTTSCPQMDWEYIVKTLKKNSCLIFNITLMYHYRANLSGFHHNLKGFNNNLMHICFLNKVIFKINKLELCKLPPLTGSLSFLFLLLH